MTAVLQRPGPGQEVRAPLGAVGLHAGHPRRAGRRAGRPQRRRQDHAAEPGRRPADADPGTIEVLGGRPAAGPEQLAKVGFVAQDTPTYAGLSVADHLRLGARLNPGWDDALARDRIERLGLDLTQRAGKLSGGQRAQLALTLGVAKRPELLILDEPVASLDPLARREFLQDLMEAVAEHELSVVLSSHLVSDLERVCDYLIVLVASRVQLAGDIDTLLATHHRLTGAAPRPRHAAGRPARDLRQPHRPADHPAGPHRGPDPRPRLDRRPSSAWKTSSWPT